MHPQAENDQCQKPLSDQWLGRSIKATGFLPCVRADTGLLAFVAVILPLHIVNINCCTELGLLFKALAKFAARANLAAEAAHIWGRYCWLTENGIGIACRL